MKALPANTSEYNWSKRESPARCYELKAGNEVYGILRFAGSCGSLATAETTQGVWTLKRQGFLSPRATVRPAGSEETAGIFKPAWGGGGEFLCRDAQYEVSATGWFHAKWTVSRDGRRVLHTEVKGGDTFVYLDGASQPEPERLSLLLVIALYVPLLAQEDAAVTVALIS